MLTWDFPPRDTGGTAAHVDGLSRALATGGHDVVVLTIADRRADLAAERTGPVRVVRANIDLPHIPEDRRLAATASANHALVQLMTSSHSQLKGWIPDVVHGHDWGVGWAADTLSDHFQAPFVLTMHGTERVRHGGNLPLGESTDVHAIEWWLAFRANRLIASSRFMVSQLVDSFELRPEQVVRIPSGIDPNRWSAPDEASAPEHGRDETTDQMVLSWGRVQYEKGFQVLARAMGTLRPRLPAVTCTIAGRGSYLPELQTQIDVEGVSDLIDLPGFVNDGDLRALIRNARCVVIPSLYEPFGVVALEALAAGAPLIAARTGGLAELIGGTDAGLTFEPGNPDDLAHCIEMVMTDRDLAQQLSMNAKRLINERYSWSAVAHSLAQVYDAAMTMNRI